MSEVSGFPDWLDESEWNKISKSVDKENMQWRMAKFFRKSPPSKHFSDAQELFMFGMVLGGEMNWKRLRDD